MREIKFRGKNRYGQFVFGDLLNFDTNTAIFTKSGKTSIFEVIPATVGQYTGLKDKNGVEIYEGDLVRTMHGVYEVGFESGAYRIKKGSLRFILVDGSCYEVLGNVHEHKSGEMK